MNFYNALVRARILILAVALSIPSQSPAADTDETRQIKTAITFNIMRFIAFPAGSEQEALQLCVNRSDAMAASLLTLQGQRLNGRPLAVRIVDGNAGFYSRCDVAYIGDGSSPDLSRLRQQGTLTIGDDSRFIAQGGTIGLVRFGRQVRFEINARRAEQSGVKVSSKLLRLAVRVIS